MAPKSALKPLTHTATGAVWYKAMNDAGYGFGPAFQKQVEVESISGRRESRSIVSLTEPESEFPQSAYPMHPACIDGCLQTSAASLWNGNRVSVDAVLVPAIIDEVIIESPVTHPETGLSVTSSRYDGLGRLEDTKSYMSNIAVYHPYSGALLFKVSGLRYHKLDTGEDPYAMHSYSRLTWKPDITHLTQHGLSSYVTKSHRGGRCTNTEYPSNDIDRVIDVVAHKKPNLRVIEINMMPKDTTSLWLEGLLSGKSIRASYSKYQFVSPDASTLIEAQEKYASNRNTGFDLLEVALDAGGSEGMGAGFDLVIVRSPVPASHPLPEMVRKSQGLLLDGAQFLLLEEKQSVDDNIITDARSQAYINSRQSADILTASGFGRVMHLPCDGLKPFRSASLSAVQHQNKSSVSSYHVHLVRFMDAAVVTSRMQKSLKMLGWDISEHVAPFVTTQSKGIILVLDELSTALLPGIHKDQWTSLQNLAQNGSKVLWVTQGSQLNVTNPEKALIHGLFRTVRSEDPSLSLTTLDVENSSNNESLAAIDSVLRSLCHAAPKTHVESEYVERGGILHVSRVLPDDLINHAAKEDRQGSDFRAKSLHHSETCIRLECEQLGSIDSLRYAEISAAPLPVPIGCVEVELAAAGVNFKVEIVFKSGVTLLITHVLLGYCSYHGYRSRESMSPWTRRCWSCKQSWKRCHAIQARPARCCFRERYLRK